MLGTQIKRENRKKHSEISELSRLTIVFYLGEARIVNEEVKVERKKMDLQKKKRTRFCLSFQLAQVLGGKKENNKH